MKFAIITDIHMGPDGFWKGVKRKIGTNVVEFVDNFIKTMNNAVEFLGEEKDTIVQVATYNAKAINFYKKLGFIDYGKRFAEEKHRMPVSGKLIPEMELIIKTVK